MGSNLRGGESRRSLGLGRIPSVAVPIRLSISIGDWKNGRLWDRLGCIVQILLSGSLEFLEVDRRLGHGRGGSRGNRGCGGHTPKKLRGMPIQARADSVDVQEETTVGHLAQVHEMHLDTGGSQDRQGGAHRRVDLTGNHDQTGTRADSWGHRIAELRPASAETLGSRRILTRQVRPGQGSDDGQT